MSFVSISGSDFPDRLLRNQFQSRQLHGSASVITIPKQFYGEEIKPNSLTITDESLGYGINMPIRTVVILGTNDPASTFPASILLPAL